MVKKAIMKILGDYVKHGLDDTGEFKFHVGYELQKDLTEQEEEEVKTVLEEVEKFCFTYGEKDPNVNCYGFNINDINERIEDVYENVSLTLEEKQRVLALMESEGDVSIGIDWDLMDYCIDIVIDERK